MSLIQRAKLWPKYDKKTLVVAATSLAALMYCSWPLGFVLNPFVGRHDLASELEAPHQPYNWLFITLDVTSGLCLLAISLWQYRALIPKYIKLSVLGYGIFGLFDAAAAVIPLPCDPTTQQCGPIIDNPLILFHGIASILSVAALFGGTVLMGIAAYRHEATKKTWRFTAPILLACWLLFGIGSLIEMALKIKNNILQDFFITLCSLSVVAVVILVERLSVATLLAEEVPIQAENQTTRP